MPVNVQNPADLQGVNVVGSDGSKLGKVDEIYLDDQTDRPEWAAVKTGLLGGSVSLVPLAVADFDGTTLSVPFSKEQLKGAPHHDPGQELSQDDERELFEHYGVSYSGETVTADDDQESAAGGPARPGSDHGDDTRSDLGTSGGDGTGHGQTGQHGRTDSDETGTTVGHDTSGPTTDQAMTRSEERLRVGTEKREAGRARLRKYITSETVTETVPVSHEEVRVEREPITDANRGDALDGGGLTEEEHEVTLHEERAVAQKETVPVERVRLDTETVTSQETVTEEVRSEQIDTEGVEGGTAGRDRDGDRDRDGVQDRDGDRR